MTRRLLGSVAALVALIWSASASAVAPDCRDLVPPAFLEHTKRDIIASDLVALRDIGQAAPEEAESPIAVSPDGNLIAFQLRRAVPAANAYCLGMFVVRVNAAGGLTMVDQGGSFMLDRLPMAGRRTASLSSGYPAAIRPEWSPDGVWIAYLRRDDGVTQLWRAKADGSRAEPVTHAISDVTDFAWSADGRAFVYATHPGIAQARASLAKEALSGFHYDERFYPSASPLPLALDQGPLAIDVADLATGRVRGATAAERQLITPDRQGEDPPGAELTAQSSDGQMAWTAPRSSLPVAKHLWVRNSAGQTVRCASILCTGRLTNVWWTQSGGALLYARREGWALAQTGVYRWEPGQPPRQLMLTDDALVGCEIAGNALACAIEGSTTPRHIERIDAMTGQRTMLFDPNPEFARLRLGAVERLHWRNRLGFETLGDLVLPPDYRRGTRLPLIVVQYSTRGFLRGGTGHDYPIQLFAARGYAVLSFQRPKDYGELTGTQDIKTFFRADMRDFADRWSVLSSLERGVQLLVDRGVVDPRRVGLTGLSDGAVTVQFALLHSHVFAAAAASSCCLDRDAMVWPTTAMADLYRSAGYPSLRSPAPGFAKGYFVSASAGHLDTPLLIQASDHEYLAGLYAVTALREARKPVDLYVYPDEYHLKWQPAHRLATYQRGLQWFDFWLRDREDPNPIDTEQYQRWSAWKAQRGMSPTRLTIRTHVTSAEPRLRHPQVRAVAGSDHRKVARARARRSRSLIDRGFRWRQAPRRGDARATDPDRGR
ncbi:hypothetical protein GCM10008023_35870 [Sphingomonas glacialis]|uniref:Peptidase S9 prolyl oligopeptidase catalytic domain-containing protein n=1 Tax=Sphingomonas glacialis TaxID=658225 RepID=A0ABQ3LT93_9SPHN|nr:hypothetical protein GCM10008023_35870 [Sphingomonas glacialis]